LKTLAAAAAADCQRYIEHWSSAAGDRHKGVAGLAGELAAKNVADGGWWWSFEHDLLEAYTPGWILRGALASDLPRLSLDLVLFSSHLSMCADFAPKLAAMLGKRE